MDNIEKRSENQELFDWNNLAVHLTTTALTAALSGFAFAGGGLAFHKLAGTADEEKGTVVPMRQVV